MLHEKIERQKAEIQKSIENFDSYWAAKIVAETIRMYEKENAQKAISEKFQMIIKKSSEKLTKMDIK